MTISNGYTTLADVKSYLDVESIDVADDAVIERLIESASRGFDNDSGRRFWTTAADETRTYTAEWSDVVFVEDIISITTLKTDDDGDRVYETTWATTDYDLLPENASLNGFPYMMVCPSPNGRYSFPTTAKAVQIVGKFGWSATAPAKVKAEIEKAVVNAYKQRFGENTTAAATITGAGVVITPKDLSDSYWKTVAVYRKLV